MSYYGPQARNGANLPHRVTFATFAEGKIIEGKLSDFKTPETKHLWVDSKCPMPTTKPKRKKAEPKPKEEPNIEEMNKRMADRRAWLDGEPMPEGTKEFFKRRKAIAKITYMDELKEMEKTGWYSVTKAAHICKVNESTVRIWVNTGIVKNVKKSQYRCNARYVILEEIKTITKNRSQFIEKRKGKAA